MFKYSSAIGLVMLVAAGICRADQTAASADLTQLQAEMQTYINTNLVEGALLSLNEKTGDVTPLYPAKAHPMIMSLGPYYVLCTDFRDEQGKDVLVNFYLARKNGAAVVFHTTYGHDENLDRLVKQGIAKALN